MGHILISVLSWSILISVRLSKPIYWSSSLSSHVPLSLRLLISKTYQHWKYVCLSALPIWLTCPSILPYLNCPNYIKWATWISKFLKCNTLNSIQTPPPIHFTHLGNKTIHTYIHISFRRSIILSYDSRTWNLSEKNTTHEQIQRRQYNTINKYQNYSLQYNIVQSIITK